MDKEITKSSFDKLFDELAKQIDKNLSIITNTKGYS